MRHFVLFAFTLIIAACSSLSSAERAERAAKVAQSVEKALAERRYTVSINTMLPRRGKVVNVSPDYSLEVKGDTLVSYLPYFGRAYNVPYGGGKGLRFKAPITGYFVDSTHRNRHIIYIDAVDTEDSYSYIITLFDAGNAAVSVTPRQRSHIEFTGHFNIDEK